MLFAARLQAVQPLVCAVRWMIGAGCRRSCGRAGVGLWWPSRMEPISPRAACDLCSSSDVVNSSLYAFAPTLWQTSGHLTRPGGLWICVGGGAREAVALAKDVGERGPAACRYREQAVEASAVGFRGLARNAFATPPSRGTRRASARRAARTSYARACRR